MLRPSRPTCPKTPEGDTIFPRHRALSQGWQPGLGRVSLSAAEMPDIPMAVVGRSYRSPQRSALHAPSATDRRVGNAEEIAVLDVVGLTETFEQIADSGACRRTIGGVALEAVARRRHTSGAVSRDARHVRASIARAPHREEPHVFAPLPGFGTQRDVWTKLRREPRRCDHGHSPGGRSAAPPDPILRRR